MSGHTHHGGICNQPDFFNILGKTVESEWIPAK
jgi:hypothetical protein